MPPGAILTMVLFEIFNNGVIHCLSRTAPVSLITPIARSFPSALIHTPPALGVFTLNPSTLLATMERAFAEYVPESRRHPNIVVVEEYAMEAAFNRLAPLRTHEELVLYTDNTTLFHGLANATSRGLIMATTTYSRQSGTP